MLRISKSREVWWPAEISVPEDGGRASKFECEIRIKVPHGEDPAQNDREFVASHVVDWRGIEDESGVPLPFSRDALAAVLNIPYIFRGFLLAVSACSRGIAAKN